VLEVNLEFHPLAQIFPLIEGAEFNDLVGDIRAHGVREPIWIYDGQILDGRNRYRASAVAGVDCPMREYFGDDPVEFVISLNLKRRHLNESQRQMVAAKLANLGEGRPINTAQTCAVSQEQAAELLNVSRRGVQNAKVVRRDGAPELVAAVEQGKVSVSAAADVATKPKHEQREIVARGEREILEAAKAIRIQKAEARRLENEALRAANPVLIPDGQYSVIVIDPPWDMKKIERDVRENQVDFEYPTMTLDELAAMNVGGMAADDCHFFCWTTQKYLPPAMELLGKWGFRYVLTMVWHKPGGFQPIGLPQYNCEFVLYGRKGSPQFVDTKQFFCCFEAPRREHSRKPDEFYDLIRRVTDGPRIDVFSREARDGFAQYGNETPSSRRSHDGRSVLHGRSTVFGSLHSRLG
jgi:N6-adenosine-specific RNA methylase IME4